MNPVGGLIIDAEAKAKKKTSQAHTSTAPCGCQVTVGWFTKSSRLTQIERCHEHTPEERRMTQSPPPPPPSCSCGCGCQPDGDWHWSQQPWCRCVANGCSCVTDRRNPVPTN